MLLRLPVGGDAVPPRPCIRADSCRRPRPGRSERTSSRWRSGRPPPERKRSYPGGSPIGPGQESPRVYANPLETATKRANPSTRLSADERLCSAISWASRRMSSTAARMILYRGSGSIRYRVGWWRLMFVGLQCSRTRVLSAASDLAAMPRSMAHLRRRPSRNHPGGPRRASSCIEHSASSRQPPAEENQRLGGFFRRSAAHRWVRN